LNKTLGKTGQKKKDRCQKCRKKEVLEAGQPGDGTKYGI